MEVTPDGTSNHWRDRRNSGSAGFSGSSPPLWQRFAESEEKAVAAREFWNAMCDVLIQTADSYEEWVGQGDARYEKYLELWYSRANDIWEMMPEISKSDPSHIRKMVELHMFITNHLAVRRLGLDGMVAFKLRVTEFGNRVKEIQKSNKVTLDKSPSARFRRFVRSFVKPNT